MVARFNPDAAAISATASARLALALPSTCGCCISDPLISYPTASLTGWEGNDGRRPLATGDVICRVVAAAGGPS